MNNSYTKKTVIILCIILTIIFLYIFYDILTKEYKECLYCSKLINIDARVCPYCQKSFDIENEKYNFIVQCKRANIVIPQRKCNVCGKMDYFFNLETNGIDFVHHKCAREFLDAILFNDATTPEEDEKIKDLLMP